MYFFLSIIHSGGSRFLFAGGGGGSGGSRGPNRPRPPFFFFLSFPFHPGGRSGRRTVPLPHNVDDAKKCVRVPPPPPPLSDLFQAWRGIAAFGFPSLPFHKSWIRHCWGGGGGAKPRCRASPGLKIKRSGRKHDFFFFFFFLNIYFVQIFIMD